MLTAGRPDHFVKLNENHYETKCNNGICPYLNLKDNSCSIHEVRPIVCRSFPVYVESKNGKTNLSLVDCPLSRYLSHREINVMAKQAVEVKEIITTTFSSSKLPEEDLKLIEKRFSRFKLKELETPVLVRPALGYTVEPSVILDGQNWQLQVEK